MEPDQGERQMAEIGDVVVINHNGKSLHANPYLPGGVKISKFLITEPGSMDVLHTVEGSWATTEEAQWAVKEKVSELINKGKL